MMEAQLIGGAPVTPARRGPRLHVRRASVLVGSWPRRFVTYWWLTALTLAVWELWARVHESVFFPPVSDVFRRMIDNWFSGPVRHLFVTTEFTTDVGTSLRRLAVGWGLAVVAGVVAGIALGASRSLAAFFNPLVRFSMAIPATAVLPVAVVIFGIEDRMNVFLIAFGTVWTVLVHAMDGVQGVDNGSLLAAKSLRLSRRRYIVEVVLPAALPRIFAGLRVSLGIGVILMVVSELFAATEGIGYFLVYSQKSFAYLDMWAAILLIGLLGIAINGAFGTVERRVLRWHLLQAQHANSGG